MIGLMATPLRAQETGESSQEADQAADGADIVVEGLRLREDEVLPVETLPNADSNTVSRQINADAARFARCAGLPRPELLRRIVDGRPETGETEAALHQHILRNSGCYSGFPSLPPSPQSPYYGACNPILLPSGNEICRVPFDRGEIYERVLKEYAPDLALDRSITFDPAIRNAFRQREEPRNAARFRAGDFYWVLACLVQTRPEYALALLKEEPGSEREARLRALMISDGSQCMGGHDVSKVRVDARQFRAFLPEAVYSWAVAARGADSLLPPDFGR